MIPQKKKKTQEKVEDDLPPLETDDSQSKMEEVD